MTLQLRMDMGLRMHWDVPKIVWCAAGRMAEAAAAAGAAAGGTASRARRATHERPVGPHPRRVVRHRFAAHLRCHRLSMVQSCVKKWVAVAAPRSREHTR